MKWLKYLVLLGAVSLAGCGGTVDTSGDENDPEVTGSDAEQMQGETGEVQ